MDIKEFKEKLEKERVDILKRIQQVSQPENFGDDIDGYEEDADETEENTTKLGIQESFEERLENIESALRKIEHGTYGVCEICGSPIEKEVLSIDPESAYCRSCKIKHKGI